MQNAISVCLAIFLGASVALNAVLVARITGDDKSYAAERDAIWQAIDTLAQEAGYTETTPLEK